MYYDNNASGWLARPPPPTLDNLLMKPPPTWINLLTTARLLLRAAPLWREFNSNNVVFAASLQNWAVNVNIFQNSEFFRDLTLSSWHRQI